MNENNNNSSKKEYILLGILLFAIVLRIYYLFVTIDQPVWWDEAEYLSAAKNWASQVPYEFNPQRPILLSVLEAVIFMLGGGEWVLRFMLGTLPSLGIVLFTYLLGKEMYDKNTGLIASFLMSSFWLLLFNTARLHVEALLLFFTILSIYALWKGFVNQNNKYKIATGLFLGLSFLTKFTSILLIAVSFLFLLITKRTKLFKDKHAWLSLLLFVITILPYFIWSKIKFGSFFVFLTGSREVTALLTNSDVGRTFGWYVLNFIPQFTLTLLLIAFFVGIYTLKELVLGFDLFLKNQGLKRVYADFFNVIFIVANFLFFIFIQRSAEDRWLLPIAISLFLLIALGLQYVHQILVKFKVPKIAATIFILLVMGAATYAHISRADQIIDEKKESYLQVKQAALWLKENTKEDDVIITASAPQTTYYSERKTIGYGPQEDIEEIIKNVKPKYLTYSLFERHPEWVLPFLESNQSKFIPIQAFFLDQEQKQLALVIYEIKY